MEQQLLHAASQLVPSGVVPALRCCANAGQDCRSGARPGELALPDLHGVADRGVIKWQDRHVHRPGQHRGPLVGRVEGPATTLCRVCCRHRPQARLGPPRQLRLVRRAGRSEVASRSRRPSCPIPSMHPLPVPSAPRPRTTSSSPVRNGARSTLASMPVNTGAPSSASAPGGCSWVCVPGR